MPDDVPTQQGPDSLSDAPTFGGPMPAGRAPAGVGLATQTIGPYRVLRELGRGGFGVVYEAEQTEPIRRRVAVKVLGAGMDSASVLARFEVERRTLAAMEHPCIARVLDAGSTATGTPYFAMELVTGEPITAFCDRHALGVNQRVAMFARVCDAVQHAHHKGVIHRDLKPGNILASRDDEGVDTPKVIDFGIAKAIDDASASTPRVTRADQIVGTPQYMSPEQALAAMQPGGGDIDTRTDVYSLGVVLYELLTGEWPLDLDRVSPLDLARVLRDVDPVRPSVRLLGEQRTATREGRPAAGPATVTAKRIRGDLDWVVMKCMEKDRSRRYQSAGAVADDLRRYLADLPVTATPPTAGYLIGKFLRRRRGLAAAAAAVLVAVAGGMAGTIVYAYRAAAARDAAEALTRDLRSVAEFQSLMLTDLDPEAMGKSLVAALSGAAPDAARAVNGTTIAASLLDEHVLRSAESVARSQYETQPMVRGMLLHTIATATDQIGFSERALEAQRLASADMDRALGKDSPEAIGALVNLGVIASHVGEFDLSERSYREALARIDRVMPVPHAERAVARDNLAQLYSGLGRPEALDMHQAAIEEFTRAAGPDDVPTLRARGNYAATLQTHGKDAEAVEILETCIARAEASGVPADLVLTWRSNLAYSLVNLGRIQEAAAINEAILPLKRAAAGDANPGTLQVINNLASCYEAMGDMTRAEALYREAIAAIDPAAVDTTPLALTIVSNLAYHVELAGDIAGAEAMYRRVIDRRTAMLGRANRDTIIAINNIAAMYREAARFVEAEPHALEAFELGASLDAGDPLRDRLSANVVKLYDRWQAADPAAGAGAKADAWRTRLGLPPPE